MEYFELPAASANAMFDKIMAAENMRGPFSTSGPGGAGYRPMPIPVFNHAKAVATLDRASLPQPGPAELARRAFIPSIAGISLSPISLQGLVQHQTPIEAGSSLLGDGAMEKGKKNGRGEGGGRGSRGGGTTGRKRSRGGQMTESVTTGSVMEGSLSGGGGAQSTGRAAAANVARQQNNSNGEKAEKSTGRRQSGQGSKRGEKKQPQPVAPSLSDTPCALYSGNPDTTRAAAETNGFTNGWTSGVLDIYGLRTRPMNIGQYMVDIPLNDLLRDGYEAPKLVLKEYQEPEKVEDDETFDQKINSILQLFPVRPSNGETRENVGSKPPKHSKVLLDLESPIPPDYEEGFTRQERTEIGAGKDTRVGSHMGAATSGPTQSGSSFKIEGLPLHPFEDFMTRLKLGPSDSLQSLIAQAQTQADTDLNATTDTRMNSAVVEQCHRNGSIPPLSCSYPPVGPVKPEHCRWNQRVWCLQLPAPITTESCEAGPNGGDTTVVDEEDAAPKSPNSRRRKVESMTKAETPEPMQVCVPPSNPSCAPSAPLPSHETQNCVVPVKEEPRQVENAVVLSSEGAPNPMEVDSCRIDNGAMAVTVTDRPETVSSKQVDNVECDQERNGGEAVRPLETAATLAGPQETDVCDRLCKSVADIKQEAVEHEAKDLVQSNEEPKTDQILLKAEQSPARPSLDLKVVCPSPTRNEPSSALPAVPLSPGVSAAAHILVSLRNSTQQVEPEKPEGERERKRRVFQPYQGAPTQKATKSMRVSSTNQRSGGEGGKESRPNTDGGSVPPSKALVSERRKSLSQIDTPEKPSISSPRNSSGGGVSTSSRGGLHTGARTSGIAVKMEKCVAKESLKDASNNKDAGGRSLSSLPPLSTGLTPVKNAHKGAKSNGYAPSSNPKGSAATTTANFAKIPTPCITQRVASGGGSRTSRPVHNNTPASHGTAPIPAKSSRQSIPDGRLKAKTDGSSRGAKSSRD